MQSIIRRAAFCGSWYPGTAKEIISLFDSKTKFDKSLIEEKIVKGIISPHAGYTYSAPVASKGFSTILGKHYDRVIVLGPCHRYYTDSCLLTQATELECPLGNIKVDVDAVNKLKSSNLFKTASMKVEQQEHSLELMLPFLKYAIPNEFKCIFIMVGDITNQQQEQYADVLLPYMKDDNTLFVISSDFCHWGMDFEYTLYNKSKGKIYESIEWLDKLGAQYICNNDAKGFNDYIDEYENTICGKNPIAIYLHLIKKSGYSMTTTLMDYAQSSQVTSVYDTSVSYCGISSHIN
ncbi:hypothetical protein WA158_001273 [Blastocystis sp. Blastoise]